MTIPNLLTTFRLLLTPVIIYYFLEHTPLSQAIATAIFFVAAFTDWYDGYYARKHNLISRLGQFLDPLADKILVSGILIAFYLNNYIFGWIVFTIIARDFVITFLRSYALIRGKPIVTSALAKWKTFSQMLAILILLIYLNLFFIGFTNDPSYYASYADIPGILFLIAATLTVLSALMYFYENRDIFVLIYRDLLKLIDLKR